MDVHLSPEQEIIIRQGDRNGKYRSVEYIESQKWDEDDQGLKITAPAEP